MILLYFHYLVQMKCYENFSMFQNQETPFAIESIPDELKPIAQKKSHEQNFDIILNKFFNNNQLTDIQLQQLSQHQKVIFEEVKRKVQAKTKRPDQYQKMFFKKAFKFADHTFFRKNKKNRSRRMSQFYHHHFDSPAKALKIPLINFYHPQKKTKPGLSTGQKSFNSSYIRTILKSQSFRKVCLEYHQKFKQDCQKQRNKKIHTFSSSISSMIERNKQDITKSIRFLQSSKCKIPWSNRDIQQAYKKAAQQLDEFFTGEDHVFTREDEQKRLSIRQQDPLEQGNAIEQLQQNSAIDQLQCDQYLSQEEPVYLLELRDIDIQKRLNKSFAKQIEFYELPQGTKLKDCFDLMGL